MTRTAFRLLSGTLLTAIAVFGFVTQPDRLPDTALAGIAGDAARGEQVFWASGCASCHAAPGAEGEAMLVLAGGREFPSPFGTFVAPNISQHPEAGIGGWSDLDLANALKRGVAPDGRHYYPAFPYAAYTRMTNGDVADLAAYLRTLPSSDAESRPHDLPFPVTIRRGLGLWKALFVREDWVAEASGPEAERGRYLVEALAHCGECHTPRTLAGALYLGRWMAGGPIPGAARGSFPNITPAALDWSEVDIVAYLTTGFTPDYDSAGGHMAEVVANMARLPESDRKAIAAYLKALPPVE